MRAQTVGARDIAWVRGVLWPDERLVRVTTDETPEAGFRRVESFAVVPSAERPRLLVSTTAGGGRAGFMQFNDSMSQRARLTKALGGILFDLGIGRRLARDRLHVDVRDDLEPAGLTEALVERHLAQILDEPEPVISVTFGSLRPNRKPVLQVARPGGSVAGYAKVAWNELTDALVRNEAGSLRTWREDPPRTFRVPELIHHGTWRERQILVTSGFRSSVWRRGRLNAWPQNRLLREIAERDGLMRSPIVSSPMWRELRQRGSSLTDPTSRDRLTELADRFDRRFDDVEVMVGSWHGDWAPWNMTWADGRPAIWDWERARTGVPMGLDAIHFAFQVSFREVGRDPREAGRRALPFAEPCLAELGVRDAQPQALLAMYLFELFHRYEDATVEGVLAAEDPIRSGILDTLTARLGGGAP